MQSLIDQVHQIDNVTQAFRTHRLFQLLKWIDALSRGYEAPNRRPRPAETPLKDESHRTPTISNLAYYLLTDAEYNKNTLEDRFSSHALRGTPDKKVFNYIKQDLTRHLAQYPGDLFTTATVQKTTEDHPTFDAGLESRCVEAKAYYLTKHGRDRLADLTDVMQFKSDLITTQRTTTGSSEPVTFVKETRVLTDDALDRIVGEVDSQTVKTDAITVPAEQRRRWEIKTYRLPHVAVVDAAQDRAPTVYRD